MSQSQSELPQHVAIIMDGNGRWAQKRNKRRVAGHKEGMNRAREIAEFCGHKGIRYLTLFAFSSENWQRPEDEVSYLMELFIQGLNREAAKLNKNNVRLKILGDRSRFSEKLQNAMAKAEAKTAENDGLYLNIAANYGGRWDILQAAKKWLTEQQLHGDKTPLTEEKFANYLDTDGIPEVDLLIRTGGEQRISNFLLWQSAYAELFFSPALWPDFNAETMEAALQDYASRQRRFGKTGEQIVNAHDGES